MIIVMSFSLLLANVCVLLCSLIHFGVNCVILAFFCCLFVSVSVSFSVSSAIMIRVCGLPNSELMKALVCMCCSYHKIYSRGVQKNETLEDVFQCAAHLRLLIFFASFFVYAASYRNFDVKFQAHAIHQHKSSIVYSFSSDKIENFSASSATRFSFGKEYADDERCYLALVWSIYFYHHTNQVKTQMT